MSIGLQERGWDATGFGWIGPNAWPIHWKLDRPAIECADWAPIPADVNVGIAHTRWATQGKPENPENNHPVVAPGIVLVHNGVLSNDDEIFRLLECERRGQVDSEAVAALLSYGREAFGEDDPAVLLELVEGDAALAWLDGNTPTKLHLARLRSRPMELAWTDSGDLLMASTPAALQSAVHKRAGIVRRRSVAEGTYLIVEGGEIVYESIVNLPKRAWSYTGPATTTTPARSERPTAGAITVNDRRARTYEFGGSKSTVIEFPGRTSRSVLSRNVDSLEDPFEEWEYEQEFEYATSRLDNYEEVSLYE